MVKIWLSKCKIKLDSFAAILFGLDNIFNSTAATSSHSL